MTMEQETQEPQAVRHIIKLLRHLYQEYQTAKNQLEIAESNAEASPFQGPTQRAALRDLVKRHNRAKYRLEYALGCDFDEHRVVLGNDLGWIDQEVRTIRARGVMG